MARHLITLELRTRAAWRQWLAKHHATSPGVWLVRPKQHAGVEDQKREFDGARYRWKMMSGNLVDLLGRIP